MKILDLYSGCGLAAIGYSLAGFKVTGVDIQFQKNYPFEFIQMDALEILKDQSFVRQFDAIHASPPCQAYSKSTAPFRSQGKVYPDLVNQTREYLTSYKIPFVIENVPFAPVRPDIKLKGHMFGLNVIRERWFETGHWFMMNHSFPPKKGSVKNGDYVCIIGNAGYRKYAALPKDWRPNFDQGSVIKTWLYAMGIPSGFGPFKDTEISEGIPPAYTAYIGRNLYEYLER